MNIKPVHILFAAAIIGGVLWWRNKNKYASNATSSVQASPKMVIQSVDWANGVVTIVANLEAKKLDTSGAEYKSVSLNNGGYLAITTKKFAAPTRPMATIIYADKNGNVLDEVGIDFQTQQVTFNKGNTWQSSLMRK